MNKKIKIFCGVIGLIAAICFFIVISTVNEYARENLEDGSNSNIEVVATTTIPTVMLSRTTAAATTTTIVTTTTTTVTETEPFYVFNENSMRIHRNSCEYYDDSMEIINGNSIEYGRPCEECNPDIQIETIYEEPTEENVSEEKESNKEEEIVYEEVSSGGNCETFTGTFFGCRDRDGNSTGMGTHGAGGMELTDQYSIALNNDQRQAMGLNYGDEVYIECSDVPELTGTYIIADCGCGWGIIDVFWYDYNSIPDYIYSMGVFSMNLYY